MERAIELGLLRDRRTLVRRCSWYLVHVDTSLRKTPQPGSGADSGAIDSMEASEEVMEEVVMLVLLLLLMYITRHIIVW